MKYNESPINGVLRKNPINPRYFTNDTGKAVYLTGSHTWAVLQDMWIEGDERTAFDYDGYLDFMKRHNHNFLRFWHMALQSAGGPWSRNVVRYAPLPFARTGPGNALDGSPKFDLYKWDDSYFERMRERIVKAGMMGIYASIMLFEGWCIMWANALSPNVGSWPYHPFNGCNNINGIDGDPDGDGGFKVFSLEITEIVELEKAYIRKVIDTVNDLDNVLFEVINEPPDRDHTVLWHYHMIEYIREYEKGMPKQHPVGMTAIGTNQDNHLLFASGADWISPGVGQGCAYMFNPPAADGSKVVISDTDHLNWTRCVDRKWVWKSFLRGMNPILMDPWEALPDLTEKSASGEEMNRRDYHGWEDVRKNMGYTKRFAERIDLNRLTPMSELSTSSYCLASPGEEYLVYLPEGGSVGLSINEGERFFEVEWFDPGTGETFKADEAKTYPLSKDVRSGALYGIMAAAPFKGDAVLYLKHKR